jgi:ABC-type phosphate/phosphonate transport system substrate-binding protein
MRWRHWIRVLGSALLVSLAPMSPAVGAATPPCYVFDLPVQVASIETRNLWTPLLAELALRSGVCLRAHSPDDFSSAESRLASGSPDFAIALPTSLFRLQKERSYTPIVTSGRLIRAMLVVRRDSPLTDLAALRRASPIRLGVADGKGLMLSAVPQQMLWRDGTRCRVSEFSNLANVLRAVLVGDVEVGVTTDSVLLLGRPELAVGLRPIWVSEPFLAPPLLVHPRVPKAVGEALQSAIIDLQRDAAGRQLLRQVRFPEPRPTTLKEYRAELHRLRFTGPVCAQSS